MNPGSPTVAEAGHQLRLNRYATSMLEILN